DRSGRCAYRGANPDAYGTSQQPDEAAQQQALTGLEREIAFGLLLGNSSIGAFCDNLCRVRCNAVLIVQLVNSTQTFICLCFIVKNNGQQSFHDISPHKNGNRYLNFALASLCSFISVSYDLGQVVYCGSETSEGCTFQDHVHADGESEEPDAG